MSLCVVVVSVVAVISLGDTPHGTQIAMLLGYSGVVFVPAFFRTRGVRTRYRRSAPYVKRELQRVVLIHGVYLLVLYIVAGWVLARRPELPELPLEVGCMSIAISQIILSRVLLGRAKRESMIFMSAC